MHINIMSDRPFQLTSQKAQQSPMKTISNVRAVLQQYHSGKSIGFSYVSSLKSMGLLPRTDGKYRLGQKYRPK